MDSKTCKHCKQIFHKKDYHYLGTQYESKWDDKIFCSYNCMLKSNATRAKIVKRFLMDTEHNRKVIELNNILNAKIVHVEGKGYFEDLRKDNVCFELQMLGKADLLKKPKKWDKKDRHVLIVAVPDKVTKEFNAVGFYHKGKLHFVK